MKLVTVRELSKFLNMKESTIYSWAKNGSIPSYKLNGLWRFNLEEIDAWIRQLRYTPTVSQKPPKKIIRQDIDRLVKKAIEDVTGNGYNSASRKPGRDQGLGKEEEDNGTL